MSSPGTPPHPQRSLAAPGSVQSTWQRTMALLLAAALVATALVPFLASSARAAGAEDDAVTGVSIVGTDGHPLGEIEIHNGVYVRATWAASPTAQPGDYFRVTWPTAVLHGIPDPSFDIFDEGHPERGAVATCSVERSTLTCVYTDYVSRYDDVSGTVEYSAQLSGVTDEIVFTANGDAQFSVDITVTPAPRPEYWPMSKIEKIGFTDFTRVDLYWQFDINPLAFRDVPTLEVEDVYDPSTTLVDGSWMIHWRVSGESGWYDLTPGVDYTVAFFPDEHRFTISIVNDPSRQLGGYVIRYHTDVPADAERGDRFVNDLTVSGLSYRADAEWTLSAGGTGTGSTYGTFAIVKELADQPSAEAGAGTSFTGTWSCTLPQSGEIVAGTWSVTGSGTADLVQTTQDARFPKLPVGSSCAADEDETPQGWAPGTVSEPVVIARTESTLTVTNVLEDEETLPSPETDLGTEVTPPSPTPGPLTDETLPSPEPGPVTEVPASITDGATSSTVPEAAPTAEGGALAQSGPQVTTMVAGTLLLLLVGTVLRTGSRHRTR